MHVAADYGQLEVLEYLSANGADINAKDKHGISVILAAIWEGHTKCVKFLLAKVCTPKVELSYRDLIILVGSAQAQAVIQF